MTLDVAFYVGFTAATSRFANVPAWYPQGMRVGRKMARHLFEASEAVGVRREDLAGPLGLDADLLATRQDALEWDTLVALLEQLSVRLDHDPERIRGVGRAMLRVPSYAFLQRLARTMISVRGMYEAGDRWLVPASAPELSAESTFLAEDKLRVRASLPVGVAPSAAFFHIFEGILTELPTLLGLPVATITQSKVTGHGLEAFLDVPRSSSLLGRLRRGARTMIFSGKALDVLEHQRRELAEGLASVHRESVELHALLDRLPDLVMIHRGGTLLWVNHAVVKTLGYDRKYDLVGKNMLEIVPPGAHELVKSRVNGEQDDRIPEVTEGALVTRDGRTLVCEVAPPQMVTFGGLPARLLVGRDVTERMRMQQRLITADRMASLGMLAAGVAHEVNNPLAYVLNNIELASKELAVLGDATAQSRAALAVALEGVDRIRTIVRQLLMLTRNDDRVAGALDVRAVVESTVTLAAGEIARRATLVCEYEAVPLARGTEARLGQVLLNLLVNALEAMAEGSRETNELRLAVRAAPGGQVLVEVSDNGAGIPPENVARVFDPFFTTKSHGRGTGLGLSISQRLIAEIGGELSFDSAPNRGSTFRITLPAADAEGASSSRPPELRA